MAARVLVLTLSRVDNVARTITGLIGEKRPGLIGRDPFAAPMPVMQLVTAYTVMPGDLIETAGGADRYRVGQVYPLTGGRYGAELAKEL